MKPAARSKISTLLLTGLLPAAALCGADAAAPPVQQIQTPAKPAPQAQNMAVQTPAPPVVVAQPRQYPGKISGDNAFKEQNFSDAARFYRTYREEAKLYKDTPAVLEAYECELDALILAADVPQAEKLLKEYEKVAPKESALSIQLWKIDLMLLKGNTAQAENALVKLLTQIPQRDPRRTKAELMLAAAYDLLGKYEKASGIYSSLHKQAIGSDFNRRIAERLIFSLTAAGKTEKALEILTSLTSDNSERNNEAHHFLNIYLALKGSTANSTGLKFDKKNVIRTSRQDDFFYLITSLIGDEFSRKSDFHSALNAYNLAYLYARNQQEVTDTLTRMTAMLDRMNEKEAAAKLALTLLDIFHHNTTDLKTKQFIARLFFDTGRQEQALELYTQIFARNNKKPSDMITYLIRQKQFENAEQLVKLYYKATPESSDALCSLAIIATEKGEKGQAAELYEKAYRKGDLNAASKAMRFHMELKAYEPLIKLTTHIIRAKGDNAEAYFFQAKAKEALGRLNEARTDFLFCERNGAFLPAQALFNAAAIAFRLNDYKLAKDDFKRIFTTNTPDYQDLAPEAAYWQALCAYNMNHSVDLEKTTLALQKKFPESPFAARAMLILADVYINSKLLNKAEDLLQQIFAMKTLPEITADALHKQALIAFRNKKYNDAENLLQQVRANYAEVAPLAENYYLLGDVLRAQSKFAEAAAAYDEAAKRRPHSSLAQAAFGSKGDCIFALATESNSQIRFKEAKEIYEQLLKMQDILPEYRIMTYYKIARCVQLLGDTDSAFEKYRMMLSAATPKDAATSPVIRFWLTKGMDALELIALKSTSIEKINDAIRTMDSFNRSGITEKQNYPARIQRLNHYKLQLINPGEKQK